MNHQNARNAGTHPGTTHANADLLAAEAWRASPRWNGIVRPYYPAEVAKLKGSVHIEHTLARRGAERLWALLGSEPYLPALGAMTGNQAVQMVQAGLSAVYVSGWQVAADSNPAGQMYPDMNLYPSDSVPCAVKRINSALVRADQIHHAEGKRDLDWLAPLVADGDAGFGGVLNTFELMREMIEAGAAGVHFEDQLPSAKRCGHLGGKVLVPTQEAIQKLVAARFAADLMEAPTVIMARTDANAADMLTSDVDPNDQPFVTGERTIEGFYKVRAGIDQAISRGLAYAPYADLLWCETAAPDLAEARCFADAIHARYPGKLLAYNCSPSFNWKARLDDRAMRTFQAELGAMGYRFQFVTLAGFHTLNHSMFELAKGYKSEGMFAYSRVQEAEFASERHGYAAATHQRFVGAGYFDQIALALSRGTTSTGALQHSTEEEQFSRNGARMGVHQSLS